MGPPKGQRFKRSNLGFQNSVHPTRAIPFSRYSPSHIRPILGDPSRNRGIVPPCIGGSVPFLQPGPLACRIRKRLDLEGEPESLWHWSVVT
jgi:hypothetical protein